MAGGLTKYRHLSRDSAHRRALLRNLVTSLITKESIHTTYAKAKEAQRLAEKLITLAKRNTEFSKRRAQGILFTPHQLLPKLFGPIRERYVDRAGGYTRVLRTEPKNAYDQGASAILELVDGKRDMRFHMTAAAVARDRQTGNPHSDLTLINMKKVTQGRKNGMEEFEKLVQKFEDMKISQWGNDGYMPPDPEVEGGEDDEGFEGLADVVERGELEEGASMTEERETPTRRPGASARPGRPATTTPKSRPKQALGKSKMTEFGEARPRLKTRNDAFDTIFDSARAKLRRGQKHVGKATF